MADSDDFIQAFGHALERFLVVKGWQQTDLADQLELDEKNGKQRINSYCRRRSKPDAELLCLLCTKVGFSFEYRGFTIVATSDGQVKPVEVPPTRQLPLPFDRKFNLTDQHGTVSVSVKRPAGRVQISVRLDTRITRSEARG